MFRNVHSQRQTAVQGLLGGIPGLTVNWTAIHVSRGGTLESSAEYQAFLTASKMEKLNQDPNPRGGGPGPLGRGIVEEAKRGQGVERATNAL